jgi:hypothetical protein
MPLEVRQVTCRAEVLEDIRPRTVDDDQRGSAFVLAHVVPSRSKSTSPRLRKAPCDPQAGTAVT